MAKISPKRRRFLIRKKQNRREKLRKLRTKYVEAKTKTDKDKVLEKVFKIAPHLTKKEFLEPIKKEEKKPEKSGKPKKKRKPKKKEKKKEEKKPKKPEK